MIKTVFIDIDDTLLDFKACAKWAIIEAFQSCSLEYHESYYDIFLEENDNLWQMVEQGCLGIEELHRRRWCCIFSRLNVDYDGHYFEQLFVNNLCRSYITVEGAEDILRYLSERYAVYAASNAIYQEQVERLTLAGLMPYLKGVFTSELAGVAKPDRKFFDYCCEQSQSVVEECVMIGDSLSSDVLGAKQAGIKMIWFKQDSRNVPADFEGEIVYSLAEIKNIL